MVLGVGEEAWDGAGVGGTKFWLGTSMFNEGYGGIWREVILASLHGFRHDITEQQQLVSYSTRMIRTRPYISLRGTLIQETMLGLQNFKA